MDKSPLLNGDIVSFRRFFLRNRPQKSYLIAILCLLVIFLYFYPSYFSTDSAIEIVDKIIEKPSFSLNKIVIIGKDDMNGKARAKRVFSDSTGCNFPKLETFGAELMHFIKTTEPLRCAKEENWIFLDAESKLRKIEKRKEADCKIQYKKRSNDFANTNGEKEDLIEGEQLKGEIAIVNCTQGDERWSLPFLSVTRREDFVRKSKDGRMNVLLISFDSTSHQHFRRKLPLSMSQLERMGAVVLNGYTIVGDGTPQAFIPILTGQTELELPNTRRRYPNSNYVDVYPFIWKNFSANGYLTAFAEDDYSIGMFTYRLKGFDKQPTDFYTRNFFKEAEIYAKGGKPYCLGSEEMYKTWFRFPREILQRYPEVPVFVVQHQGTYSHDDMNMIEVQDAHFAEQLADWEKLNLLENTVLIVMADHGHRFMKIRNTHQGQLEERLPLFSITLPKKMRKTAAGKQILENLKANSEVLTTPFDVYSTLSDILELPKDLTTPQDVKKRSLSLFRPIPKERICENAGLEAHWCTCLNWQDALQTEKDREQTQILALGLVQAIDEQLKDVRNLCSPIKFKNVISATKLIPNESLLKYNNVKDKDGFVPLLKGNTTAKFAHYQLKVTTNPNDAIYEATVFFDGRTNELEVDFQSISHVNAYGGDPHCVVKTHNTLSLFCVCFDKIRK